MDRAGIFDAFLDSKPIFKNREVLRPSYTPDELPHRQIQINQLASILAPALHGETPSNIFIYGKTGTGKTACTRYVSKELIKTGESKKKEVVVAYINCEIVDTQYRVLANLSNCLTNEWSETVPFTGLPTDEVYERTKKKIDAKPRVVIIILDEVDKLVFKGSDDVLYSLSRINSELEVARVSLIGISNDLKFTEFIDTRVKSSLGAEEIVFPPYNAEQLKDILSQRADLALYGGALKDQGVIALCAALAAQEHGDARRALDLLRVAAELAERAGSEAITEEHVRKAQNKIEQDKVIEVVRTLPTQSKILLMSTIIAEENGVTGLSTGEIYSVYKDLCKKAGTDVLTQRRVTDLVSELDMLGIVNARIISKGRYGRTKEIYTSSPIEEMKKALEEDTFLRELMNIKISIRTQSTLDKPVENTDD